MSLRGASDEDDDAPWLASAEPDGRETYVSRKRFRLVTLLLGALVLVVAALLYAVIARPHGDDGAGFAGEAPLIRAADGSFKTRPADAGGMAVEGLNQTTYEAAGGVDPQGELALDQIPEEPMARPVAAQRTAAAPPPVQATPQPAPLPRMRDLPPPEPPQAPAPREPEPKAKPLPTVKTVSPAEKPKVVETPKPGKDRLADVLADVDKAAAKVPKPKPEADLPSVSGGGGSLQLGAFSSSAKAEAAWKAMQRYGYIAGLTKSVVKVEKPGGETVYRLRATGVESREKASNLCARLKVAGEQCVVSE